MRYFLFVAFAINAWGQAPQPLMTDKDATQLGTRTLQLMESTAVAMPGLVRASEPVRQNAEATLGLLNRAPLSASLTYQFMSHLKAYLALSDSLPRPSQFPLAADAQFAELRENLQRLQRHFEAVLELQNQNSNVRNSDPNELKHFAGDNGKLLPAAKTGRVVFFGDSITENWRLNEYFTGKDFVNRGIHGQNTMQLLGRFRQDVLALNPKGVLIHAGTNDISGDILLAQIEDNLAMMGELAKARGIKVAFAASLPVSDYHKAVDPSYEVTKARPPAAIVALNKWLEAYCKSEGFVFADYYSAVVDAGGQLRVDFSDDGLHPNARGYRAMSTVALDATGKLLAAPEDPAATKRRFGILGR